MPFNYFDQEAVNKKRQQKINMGYKAADVDEYISKQRSAQEKAQLLSEGTLSREEAGTESVIEASRRGLQVAPILSDEQKKTQETAGKFANLSGDLNLYKKAYDKVNLRGTILGRLTSGPMKFVGDIMESDASDFDSQRDTLAYSLASAIANQEGRGLSDVDVKIWKGKLGGRTDTPDAVDKKLMSTVEQFKQRMRGGGMSEDEINENLGDLATFAPKERKGIVEGGVQDIKDLASTGKKLVELSYRTSPMNLMANPQDAMAANQEMLEIGKKMPKAIYDDLSSMAEDPITYIKENPVDTVLTFLPFLKVGKLMKGGKAAKVAGEAGKTVKAAEGTVEFLNGPGPKDFITRNVNKDGAQSLAQTALRHNVYNTVRTKGIIENTQKALTDVGSDLAKTYEKAVPANGPIVADELLDGIEQVLIKDYPNYPELIKTMKSRVLSSGEFQLGSGKTIITPKNIWKAERGLHEFGLKQLGLGEAGKIGAEIAKNTSRLLRERLYTEVPEAAPKAMDYGNLKVLMETLPDMNGVKDMNALSSLVGKINFGLEGVKNVGSYGAQKLYNMRGGRQAPMVAPERTLPPVPPANPASIPADMRNASSVVEGLQGSVQKPLPENIINNMLQKKGDPQSSRLVRDMRFKQGNPVFLEGQNRLLRNAGKTRYK